MERLTTLSKSRSAAAETGFERFLMHEIDWNERFVLITGSEVPEKPPCCYNT